jgi:hypothetical protein
MFGTVLVMSGMVHRVRSVVMASVVVGMRYPQTAAQAALRRGNHAPGPTTAPRDTWFLAVILERHVVAQLSVLNRCLPPADKGIGAVMTQQGPALVFPGLTGWLDRSVKHVAGAAPGAGYRRVPVGHESRSPQEHVRAR